MSANENMIFGTRAVLEAIDAGKELDKVLIRKGLSNELYNQLRKALQGQSIPIQFVPEQKLDRLTQKNHQGVVAFTTEVSYYRCEELLPGVFESGKTPLLLVLDRVTDVRNFGAIARTAECAGVDFIVIPSRGSAQINADAVKTSAGALHRIKVCREDNLKQTIGYLKESGVKLIACHEKTDKDIYDMNCAGPCAIIMGSEEDGISSEYLKHCDEQVKIPMLGKTASLNVSVATGIVLFEVLRIRLGTNQV
jgi:23S rRNA (guanosine2251-2'-O)-methyltransferase